MFNLSWFRRRGITFAQGAMNITHAVITSATLTAATITTATINAGTATLSALNLTAWPKVNSVDVDEAVVRHARVALADADTAGGILAWENPESVPINVLHLVLDVLTVSTGACTVDVGVAADDKTSDDTLIDGQDVNSATGLFANSAPAKVGVDEFITASMASGAAADLAGYAHIAYVKCAAVKE